MKKSFVFLAFLSVLLSCTTNSKTLEKENELLKKELELAEKEKHLALMEDSIKNAASQEDAAIKKFSDVEYLISKEGVGNVKLGMPISSMIKFFNQDQIKKITESGEGMEWDVYKIFTDNSTKFGLSIDSDCLGECKVTSITVLSELYKTKEFVGVGNTFTELVERIKPAYIMGTYDGIVIITEEYNSIMFDIDASGLDFAPEKQFEINDIPGNREITRIRNFSIN